MPVRVLFLADSHLGFDLPTAPRVRRRRRGDDFLANYLRALAPAFAGEVDAVVHGGDVFHAPRVPRTLAIQAYDPLRALADRGTPVFVVPGNHERGQLPHPRFALHPGIRVFDAPRTFRIVVRGVHVTFLGFPYARRGVRERFGELVAATGWRQGAEDVALLCVHHCFEGARVGPQNFMFRGARDVVRAGDVPGGLAAVLTGHVHRHQVLERDRAGRPLRAPVLYPGSTERTSFAEMGEDKGYLLLDLAPDAARPGGRLERWRFARLPARPMAVVEVDGEAASPSALAGRLEAALREAPPDAVLRLRVRGCVGDGARGVLAAGRLRSMAPPDLNVDVVLADEPRPRRGPH
ncbi:MAG TPA: metallophosphoesterase [Longimicrobiales bacterium]|nr:metallophosphoesterase [Longimicrobiales bacterium]